MVRSQENYGGLGLPKFLYLSCLPSKIKKIKSGQITSRFKNHNHVRFASFLVEHNQQT